METLRFFPYTMDARRVILHARQAADAVGGNEIAPEHLVLGLLENDVRSARSFQAKAIDLDELRQTLRRMLGTQQRPETPDIPLADETRKILDLARDEARRRTDDKVKSEDILVAILIADTSLSHLLLATGLRVDELRRESQVDRP